ncbi:hypothetical protein EMCRGX_G022542 [Ephydatia muelleri]
MASLTSASCVAALVDLACESGTAKTEATQTYASGYLCKKCFNSIAKYSGLKEELLSKLSKVHRSSSSSGAGTSEISQGTKRKADAALQGANAVKVVVTYDGCEKSSRRQCTIAGVIAILMAGVLLLTSLVLYSGHAAKQVYSRLQKLGLCLSITSTLKLLDVLGTNHDHIVMDWVKELSKLTTTSHGFITGLPTAQMFNDSVSSTYSSFGVDSLAENLFASTPPSSPSLSEYSFVGNISPITPEVSCVSSDDIPSEPNECLSQSTPVPAVKAMKNGTCDRICFSHLSTDTTEIVQDSINFEIFYPTVGDKIHLSAEATHHIERQYSKQMALKSEVVPLGVMLNNENVLGDMIDILDGLHRYIPLGGDQLTIARIRGSQSILSNSDNGEERFVPVIEDWHTKMCFMEVIWKRYEWD